MYVGADDNDLPKTVCSTYYPGVPLCFGGVMALDGQTGKTLWQHWTRRIILSVDCSVDLTGDNINDCLISGKGGVSNIYIYSNKKVYILSNKFHS